MLARSGAACAALAAACAFAPVLAAESVAKASDDAHAVNGANDDGSGPFLDVRAGVGTEGGHHEFRGTSTNPSPPHEATLETSVAGVVVQFALRGGWRFMERFAAGLELAAGVSPKARDDGGLVQSRVAEAIQASAGPFAAWRPIDEIELSLAASWASAHFGASKTEMCCPPDDIYEPEGMSGVLVSGDVAVVIPKPFAFGARYAIGRLAGAHTTYVPSMLLFEVGATTW